MTTPLHSPDDYVLSVGDLARRAGLSDWRIRERTLLPPEDPAYLDHIRVPNGRRFTMELADRLKAEVAAKVAKAAS